jgi:hypothetical protein
MSGGETILGLGVVAVLAGYLYTRHRQRMRSLAEQYDPAEWTGKGIDLTDVKPRVEEVRRNYLAARQPAKSLCFHRVLLEMARRTVVRLGYFQHRESEDHVRTHGR